MNRTQAQRLLDVATALRESPNPRKFDMDAYGHDCRTPACALGHYAARKDMQKILCLDSEGELNFAKTGVWTSHHNKEVLEHFGLNVTESHRLFSGSGCGYARTAIQAAKFIENFLDDKGWVVARG